MNSAGQAIPGLRTQREGCFVFQWKPFFYAAIVLSASLSLHAQANRVFVFPSGGSPNVTVLDASTLANAGTVVSSPNAFQAVSVPDGSKYYIVSNNATRTLTIVSANNLSAPRYVDLGTNASAAAITPDGRFLLVTAGTLKVFRTDTDAQVADVGVGIGPTDIEVSNDSRRAYVMSTTSGLISVVDLTASPAAVLNQISIGSPLSITLRPDNKSLLVLVPNGIVPVTLNTNSAGATIPVGSLGSGRILVTPDSTRAVVVNRGLPPLSVSQVINLATGAPTQIGAANQAFSQIVILDNATAFGLTTDSTVALIDLASGAAAVQTYGQNTRSIGAAPNGKTLFLASTTNSNVTRVDVSTNTPSSQAVGVAPTGFAVVFPPPTSGAANITINGGDRQTLFAGQTAPVPLSVLITTADGSPVFNAPVTFTGSGVNFSPAQQPVVTNTRGIAEVFVSLPPPASGARPDGSLAASADAGIGQGAPTTTVTAASPAGSVNFTLTVAAGTGLQIVSGDYQVTTPNTPFADPLIVQVINADGTPVPQGTVVQFVSNFQISTTTDANGFAQVSCAPGSQTGCFRGYIPQGSGLTAYPNPVIVSVVGRPDLGTVVFQYLQTSIFPVSFTGQTSGDMQTGNTGQPLSQPLCVQVTAGTLAVPIAVRWTVVDGPAGSASASFNPPFGIGGGGFYCTQVTVGPRTGTIHVAASIGGVAGSVTFTITAIGGPPQRVVQIQGCVDAPVVTASTSICNGQSGNPGQTLPLALRVQVLDASGNPVQLPNTQFPLTFTVSPPSAATLSNFFQQSDGQASVVVTLGNTPGPFLIQATAGNGIATWNMRVLPNAAAIVVLSGNNQQVPVGGATGSITVRVNDSLGNPVANQAVTISAPATVTIVPAQGQAGNPVIVNSASDGTVSFSARIGAGTPIGPLAITVSFSNVNTGGGSGSTALTVTVTGAQPVFTASSIVNAASFVPGMVPWGLATLFGKGLSQVSGTQFPGGATTFQGVTLSINGVPVPLYLIANQDGVEQINFQVRADLGTPSTVQVQLNNNGSVTTVSNVPVFPVQPGIFEYTPQGSATKYAAALKTDGSVIGPNNPISRGQAFSIFLTGAGPSLPLLQTGQVGPLPPAVTYFQPTVGIAGRGAKVLFSGVAPGLVIYQINVVVPDDAPVGNAVTLDVLMGGVPSQTSHIAVQ
jgi:uncharacterized protein (TIGR03437 family)